MIVYVMTNVLLLVVTNFGFTSRGFYCKCGWVLTFKRDGQLRISVL